MTTPFRRFRRPLGASAAAALILSLVAAAAGASSPARADTAVSCNTAVTSAPSGPATVLAALTAYGRVLVLGGSGPKAGCALYVLTSDRLEALTSQPFACPGTPVPQLGDATCVNGLWPALLTEGAPIAGPGVNPTLLGAVTRGDVVPGRPVQQVTYAGLPLYFFFMDEAPGETDGANLFDNVTSPTGIWYLVEPSRGRVAPGTATLQVEGPAANGGTGPDEDVLAASMNDGFECSRTRASPSSRSAATAATRAPAPGSVPSSGRRSSRPSGPKPDPASTRTRSGSSCGPTAPTR